MDRKASRGRKKETCGLAKNSDLNGRKKEIVAEAPTSRQAVDVCGGIKVASKACLNGSPRLDIGKGEELNGSVVGASEGAPEGPRQSKTDNHMHESERTGHHGDAMTHKNTGTESINSTAEDDGAGYLEELTPEQQRILWEKRELEELLEQTKLLQEKAATCFHRTDEKSMESEKQSLAGKQSELSSKEPLSVRKELNKRTATVVPHEQKAALSAQAEPDGSLNHDAAESSSVPSETEAPFSLRGNIKPLEENAELLYHKKVELEVLLQTAKVLLEQTALPELNDSGKEDFSFVDDTCAASFRSSEDTGNQLEEGTTNVEDDDDDDEESEDRSIVETLYERADEITRKAKLFVDMLHEDEDLGPKETQSDVENRKMVLQTCESDKTDDSPAVCLVQKENLKEEDKAAQAEKKGSAEDREVQETDEVDDVETPEQRQELQRLLLQVRQLLATLNGPQTESGSKEDESSKEVEELSRTTEKKTVEGEMVSSLDQKAHMESLKPLEVRAAENELPSGAKKEVYIEGSETDKHLQDPGVTELQPEALTNSATDGVQPGASEAVETVDKNSWSEVETTLLCEKNELSLLLMKTQLLQQKAEMIMSETHIPTAKSDLTEDSSEPSSKAAQLTPQETTETIHTVLTSDVTKPDLETTDELSKKLKQTSDTAEPSPEITKQILNTTHLSSGETGKPSVESIAEKMEPHLDETLLSSDTMKEVLEATPASSKTTQETTEVSSEKIKPMLDVTKIGSEPTNPNIKTNEKLSGLNTKASDKISLPSEAEVTSQKTSVENLNNMAENSFKIGSIPQEKKSVEENLQTTECTEYIDDTEHESIDRNLSALRIEATSRTDDAKPTESLSNNEAENEDAQSPHDGEDADSSDEDDQSFDAKEELKLLLQRARLIIEKSKIPVSERKPSLHSEMCHPAESAQEQESSNDEPRVSEAAAGKPELTIEENEGSYPQKQILNSETTNKTDAHIQQTDDVEDKTTLSQDAQLEILLAQTTLLKLKADELLNKFNVSVSDQQLPNSELSNENDVQLEQKADGVHQQINILEAALDQQSENAQLLPKEENKVASDLECCAALPSAQREEESKDADEQPKRPTELNLDLHIVASRTEVVEKEIQSSALPLNEDSQLELEEIEESQLEISENEKSQFEIEDEYLSDNSQLSDMNIYYEDAEYSQDEEEHLPEETGAVSNEECLPQAQQQKKETYNEKRELELLLEITQLLLEKATLPLELIETISDENNSHAVTQSVSETVEIGQADQADEELNLSLDDTMPALETKQMPALETKQMSSQKTETGTETTMSLNKTENILETKEAPSQKTETVTEATAPSFEKTETIRETRELSSETSKPIPKILSDITSQTQPNASNTAETSQADPFDDTTSPEFSQKLQQLQSEVASFLQSKLRSTAENSPMPENNSLQNDAGEVYEEKDSTLTTTTDKSEEVHHPDHSTPKLTTQDTTADEQGSEFQAEATSGLLPVSQTEAGKAEDLESKPFKGWTPMTSYTLLLKLQSEMSRMQLQLSNLQDAMRTTNSVIQQLMDEAFSDM